MNRSNRLVIKRLVQGLVGDAERDAFFAGRDRAALINVKKMYALDKRFTRLQNTVNNLFRFNLLVNDEGKIPGNGRKLGNGGRLNLFGG